MTDRRDGSREAGIFWITGAGSGIGEALALRLAGAGHTVLVTGRNGDRLAALKDRLPAEAGGTLVSLPCDVSDDARMRSLFREHAAWVPHLDGIILCAGLCEYIDLPDLDVASVRRVTEVNFFGVVNACAAALPLLRERAGQGARPYIAGVSSMSTYLGFHRAEAYGASKAAMAYFLDSLRCDVQEQMDVCVIYPGFVKTPMTEQNDFAMPTIVSVDAAAEHILGKLESRPRNIRFPWRLHAMLSIARCCQGLWYRLAIPRLKGKNRT